MKSLSFIEFCRNDSENEMRLLNLHIESLLLQDTEDFDIILIDLSVDEKIPKMSERIKIYNIPISIEEEFSPPHIRNIGAMLSDTPMICHINSDCIYGTNFASTLINNMNKYPVNMRRQILCKRRNCLEDFDSLEHGYKIAQNTKYGSKYSCGECQCCWRYWFINVFQGYYGLIRNGKVYNPDKTICKEDIDFGYLVKGVERIWVDNQTWILHMKHEQRQLKNVFRKKNGWELNDGNHLRKNPKLVEELKEYWDKQ
ncbi:glycosyltransferase family 2 protein [Patescibacteria group bacterium]|nr:glycosyltransferase family 2 protein [Patescibacteria group bacterium]